jgi:hypothetical protein
MLSKGVSNLSAPPETFSATLLPALSAIVADSANLLHVAFCF